MQWLFWKAIQEAKEEGLREFDLGRSSTDNEGLIQFKDRLGASRRTLRYWRYYPVASPRRGPSRTMALAKMVCAHLPNQWLTSAGSLLYRHVA